MALLDPQEPLRVVRANRAFRELLPHVDGDLSRSFPSSEQPALVRLIASLGHEKESDSREFTAESRGGARIQVRIRAAMVAADDYDRYGTLRQDVNMTCIVHVEDVTEIRSRERHLQRAARTDPLTGLANRRHLVDVLESSLQQVRPGHLLSVVFVDLDQFKDVNDRLGHAAGDQVLQTTARRLESAVRPSDLVARTGGDEFLVVSTDLPDRAAAEQAADRILKRLQEAPPVRASIGLVVTEDRSIEAEELLRRADRCMYAAKAAGGARVVS